MFHATLYREGPHVYQGKGLDLGEWHEEECPKGAGCSHRWSVTGRGQEGSFRHPAVR